MHGRLAESLGDRGAAPGAHQNPRFSQPSSSAAARTARSPRVSCSCENGGSFKTAAESSTYFSVLIPQRLEATEGAESASRRETCCNEGLGEGGLSSKRASSSTRLKSDSTAPMGLLSRRQRRESPLRPQSPDDTPGIGSAFSGLFVTTSTPSLPARLQSPSAASGTTEPRPTTAPLSNAFNGNCTNLSRCCPPLAAAAAAAASTTRSTAKAS
mmetsp:Transcript_111609/g.296630  ORF Transcript_111609/g.296630 Transcript_111609/m.296630 type:complete len:213 (-) Transcript_111609:726-1364(-)